MADRRAPHMAVRGGPPVVQVLSVSSLPFVLHCLISAEADLGRYRSLSIASCECRARTHPTGTVSSPGGPSGFAFSPRPADQAGDSDRCRRHRRHDGIRGQPDPLGECHRYFGRRRTDRVAVRPCLREFLLPGSRGQDRRRHLGHRAPGGRPDVAVPGRRRSRPGGREVHGHGHRDRLRGGIRHPDRRRPAGPDRHPDHHRDRSQLLQPARPRLPRRPPPRDGW